MNRIITHRLFVWSNRDDVIYLRVINLTTKTPDPRAWKVDCGRTYFIHSQLITLLYQIEADFPHVGIWEVTIDTIHRRTGMRIDDIPIIPRPA